MSARRLGVNTTFMCAKLPNIQLTCRLQGRTAFFRPAYVISINPFVPTNVTSRHCFLRDCVNEEQFKASLKQAPWDTVFIFDDLDDMVESWESLFNQALDSHCPWSEKRVSRDTQPPWMNSRVQKQIHTRDSCLKTVQG